MNPINYIPTRPETTYLQQKASTLSVAIVLGGRQKLLHINCAEHGDILSHKTHVSIIDIALIVH